MRTAAIAVLGAALAALAAGAEPDTYEAFNRFCARHFGAEREEEMYRAFGKELKTVEGSTWQHVSESSACFAWQTNLPAKSCVEYGTTPAYGQKTAEPERCFSLHLHHLKGLKPDTTYHYRLVATDERGNRVATPDATFETKRLAEAVRIPDDLQGPPFVLDRPNATYLVTKDIAADGTAIFIAASGIALDLNGHTITYDEKRDTANEGACAIRGHKQRGIGLSNIRVLNGLVRRGKGGSAAEKAWDTLYNPLFFSKPTGLEIAGLDVGYDGCQVVAIALIIRGEKVDVHHNAFLDRGSALFNRHLGMDAVSFAAQDSRFHHNLIKRTRHRGVNAFQKNELFANEIYIDSFATNSYGIMYYNQQGAAGLDLHHNRIFGTGYHPVGIGSGQGYSDVKVRRNYIQMQGTRAEARWAGGQGGGDDPGQLHPVNGIRLQRPRRNVEHTNNVVVARGSGEGCLMRCIWLVPDNQSGPGLVFRNNRLKLIAEDAVAEGYALSCGGTPNPPEGATVRLERNTAISNLCHVQFGDNYSHGGRYAFEGNEFIKTGSDPRYLTLRLGWRGWQYETFGHSFLDTAFQGGASFESVSFDGAGRGRYDFSVAWTLSLKAPAGAEVMVKDKSGQEGLRTKVPDTGTLAFPIVEYVRTREGKTLFSPHTIAVTHGGKTATRQVAVDKPTSLDLSGP
ncbi:MAG: hypothetical protein FJ291_24845 [Planctomycetes bacterium]|nr:hypothetical protein [Planctomycetota bacterium]